MKKTFGLICIFQILVTLLSIFIFLGCETKKNDDPLTSQEREWLTEHDGEIAMALETSYAPFAFVDENRIGKGLATEYVELIEKKLNFRIKKIQFNSLNEILNSAQKKEIDIVNAITETEDRSKYLLFTKPFIKIPNVIIVRKNRKDSLTIDKIKNMKISLVKNYAVTEYLTQNYNELDVVLMPDDLSALMSVSFNQTDATIIDLATASYFIEKKGITNLRIAGESGHNIKLAIASINDWPILNRIMEKGLSSITYKENKAIKDKWISFGQIRLSESKEFWIIMVTVFSVFLLAIVGIIVWNRLLKSQVEQRTIQLKKELAVRNQSEKELKELKLQLSNALDMAHLGHWEYDVVNDLFIFNDHFYKIFRTTAEQVGGYSMSSSEYSLRFVHPDDIHMVEEQIGKAIETDSPNFDRQLEHRMLYADGEVGYISVRYFIVKDAHGKTVKTYGVSQDITERKRSENIIKESEFQYRNLANAGLALIWTSGTDKLCNYFNDPWLKFTGRTLEQEIGNRWTEGVHPDDFNRCLDIYVTAFDRCESFEMEYRLRHASGKYRIILDLGTPNFNSNGEFIGYIGHCFDITERKQAESEKEKLQAQLLQAQKMESVGRLAGGVAHDFNNMLGVILGHAEFALENAEENSDLYADLKEIQSAAQRSADLTKQLLTFARKDIISPKQIDLNDTVESMLNMLRRLIGEDIDLVWQAGAHLWPVKMDPSQIDQILVNLCVNARDAIAGVGKLTMETGRKTFDEEYCNEHLGFIPGDFVLLAVSDNGCGMDKDTLDNLFEPFFTTKEIGKGTGLGLATIYGIVKQNNGFINVYSEPGQGSTFKIYLPRLVVDEDLDRAVPEKKTAAGGTETILLVEDEPPILRMTRMMLERKGYSVLPAATPAEAIDLAKTYADKIHLLITDVVMPEMNGRDLSGQIKAFYPGIRLLFMSGYTANVIAHQGVLDDGVAFIQKPFSIADMTMKVRGILDMAPDENQG